VAHDKYFPYKLPANATAVTRQSILEGTGQWDWKPNTLYVGVGSTDPGVPPISVNPAGPAATFRISGLHNGARYVRDFALSPGDQIEIDVCAFANVAVDVLGASFTPVAGQLPAALLPYAIVTDREVAGRERPWVILPLQVDAGDYRVPFGAVQFFPGTADPNFLWSSTDLAGNLVTIAQPVTPGEEWEVKGEYFTTSVTPFQSVWRIQL